MLKQWVHMVSSLISQHPEAQIGERQLSSCVIYLVDGEEVRMTVETSQEPYVPAVVGFSKQSKNPHPDGLASPKFAFLIRPGEKIGVFIQMLRVASVSGETATFEKVGNEEWFIPDSTPR